MKLRSVNTSFWSDPFIEDLSPAEKLLYLYLITNEKTNMLGIYEVSIKKIAFDTGIDKLTVSKALEGFQKVGKIKYVDNFIILTKYLKHQSFNTNMKKSAIDCYNNLPQSLKFQGVTISKDNPLEGFETLLKHYGILSKVEVEDEIEDEDKSKIPAFEIFKLYALENKPKVDTDALLLKYNSWIANGWKTGGDKPKQIKNWKTTLLNTLAYMPEIKKSYEPTNRNR